MKKQGSFCKSTYADQVQMAEAELSAFLRAVTELFGQAQAKLSAEDWLDESKLMDNLPLCVEREWRAVTIAASARLANRLNAVAHHKSLTTMTDMKISTMPSSSCFAATVFA